MQSSLVYRLWCLICPRLLCFNNHESPRIPVFARTFEWDRILNNTPYVIKTSTEASNLELRLKVFGDKSLESGGHQVRQAYQNVSRLRRLDYRLNEGSTWARSHQSKVHPPTQLLNYIHLSIQPHPTTRAHPHPAIQPSINCIQL